MFQRFLTLLFLLFLPLIGVSQISREYFAQRSIEKRKWENAYGMLKKSMHKDSLNVAARFIMSSYFFEPQNPAYQIDSSYHYYKSANRIFTKSSPRQRDRLERFSIDSLSLHNLGERIDSAAFERAKKVNTERAYIDFISGFPLAIQRTHAIELRNEAAYLDALKRNTYLDFEEYFLKYPKSARAKDAKILYEKLLYKTKTADHHLLSYKSFIETYPQTLYRQDAELNIFEISTALGTVESYQAFLSKFPQNHKAKQAQNILFHLFTRTDEIQNHAAFSDSLLHVTELEKHNLVPILHLGLFGFINDIGDLIIQPQASELADDYKCGNITEDVLVLSDKIISRSGSIIYSGTVDDITDLGSGFLKIDNGDCVTIIHKSGFVVSDSCVADVKMLSGKMLAIKKDNAWSVWTLSGRMLIPFIWDDITDIDDVLLFKKGNKTKLATTQAIALVADQQPLKLSDAFDDVNRWNQHLLQVWSGEYQGVLNQNLDVFIRFDKHKLKDSNFGGTAISSYGTTVFNLKGDESALFRQIQINYPWTSVKTNTLSWKLFSPIDLAFQSPAYDTIHFVGPFAIGSRIDSITVYFNPYYTIDFPPLSKIEFIPGQDSTAYLLVESNESTSLFDGAGKKLFNFTYDKIQYAGQGIFIVTKKEKKGLLGSDGKLLLPVEYDAIGTVKNNTVSILKAMKFGLFDFKKQKLIKPEYLKNIIPYTSDKLIVFRDGRSGFVGWNNKPLSKVDFEEVRYWNDTSAMIKTNFLWRLYDVKTDKIIIDKIRDFTLIQDTQHEKIAIIHQENVYGVIHNHKGVIIPSNFSDIVNVGSHEVPLYFTEKHVEEASIFVVIYYDHSGQMLRKEVYEQDEYERIYCSDN